MSNLTRLDLGFRPVMPKISSDAVGKLRPEHFWLFIRWFHSSKGVSEPGIWHPRPIISYPKPSYLLAARCCSLRSSCHRIAWAVRCWNVIWVSYSFLSTILSWTVPPVHRCHLASSPAPVEPGLSTDKVVYSIKFIIPSHYPCWLIHIRFILKSLVEFFFWETRCAIFRRVLKRFGSILKFSFLSPSSPIHHFANDIFQVAPTLLSLLRLGYFLLVLVGMDDGLWCWAFWG